MASPGRSRQSRHDEAPAAARRAVPAGPVAVPAADPTAGRRPPASPGALLAAQRLQGNRHVQRLVGALRRAPKAKQEPEPVSLPEALRHGAVLGGGKVRFYPRTLAGTRLGDVNLRAAPLGDYEDRLHVFIDQGTTLQALAELLLPLWNDAAESRPDPNLDESAVPPSSLTAGELARGLLSYNDRYLPVPGFARWQAGLRLPMPVRIDPKTGEGIVNPHSIRAYATGYKDEWEPLLTRAAGQLAAPDPAALEKEKKEFLAAHTDALGRGIALMARVVDNPREARKFAVDLLGTLPADQAFATALEFVEALGAPVLEALSSDPDGVAILNQARALLKAAPTPLPPQQQEQLTRVNAALVRGREVEIALAARDWPTVLPPVKRPAGKHITKVAGKLELKIPEVAVGTLTETQQGVVNRIKANRAALPAAEGKVKAVPYKGQANAGFSYLGEGSKGINPEVAKAEGKRQEVLKEIRTEILREGGFSAVNTFDDAVVTLGMGFTRSILATVMQTFFAADPAAQDTFLDLGFTWLGGKALAVNTDNGGVEEGDDALRLLQVDPKVLSVFVRLAESAEHGPKLATAELKSVAAANVPKSVVDTWTDMKAVRLAAHLIHWRSAKGWADYAGTGGDVKKILAVARPVIGTDDPARGGATFLTAEQTGVLFSFAEGKAKEALAAPTAADLPADIAKTSYAGNIFFADGRGKFYRMTP